MSKKSVSSLIEIPAVREYLQRIGAEPRSLLTAVVREMSGKYWQDVAVIKFARNGVVDSPEAFAPSESEVTRIIAQFDEYEFPTQQKLKGLTNLPEAVEKAEKENTFTFYDVDGSIIMLQLRRDGADGEKNYVPYTYWSDGKWRAAEPEGLLPLWGMDQLKDYTTVFIHEGAKAARAVTRMVAGETRADRDALAAHPWGEELGGAAHVGWIGGALSPARTDWGVLKRMGVKRAYIVSDNDPAGVQAVPAIAYRLRLPTFHVQFTDEWPSSFDLADPFPKAMFRNMEGLQHYVGPAFRSCLHPSTWASDLIPNSAGKPTPVLRQHFKEMWAFIEEADLWVCTEMPEIVRTEAIINKVFSAFSHTSNTTQLLLKAYQGRSTKICYRPDVKGRVVTDRSTSAINLHIPSQIKPAMGDPAPWIEFLSYVFPMESERKNVERWCATLIARPERRMEYGLLLVSEAQGIGKTTLGSEVLGKLVGDHNVGYPSEKTITDGTFTDWIANKRLIVVNEIYSGHSWKAYNTLKTYITDKDVTVNAKYQRPYVIDNWAHIIACSNSMRALRMEQDDRRWFYPEITETRWSPAKFKSFYNWLQGGGLAIIAGWAKNYGDYVETSERAPMTERKKDMIAGSRTEAQIEAAALAEAAQRSDRPMVLAMKEIEMWARQQIQGKMYDSPYDLRKVMKECGMQPSKSRIFVQNRLQYVIANTAAMQKLKGALDGSQMDMVKTMVVKPSEILEGSM
jgi:hypothetical protein